MTGEQLIAQAIKFRTEARLGLRVFGAKAEAEGATSPIYCANRETLAEWVAHAEGCGYEWEIMQ